MSAGSVDPVPPVFPGPLSPPGDPGAAAVYGLLAAEVERALPGLVPAAWLSTAWLAGHAASVGLARWAVRFDDVRIEGRRMGGFEIVIECRTGPVIALPVARRGLLAREGAQSLSLARRIAGAGPDAEPDGTGGDGREGLGQPRGANDGDLRALVEMASLNLLAAAGPLVGNRLRGGMRRAVIRSGSGRDFTITVRRKGITETLRERIFAYPPEA